METFKNNNKDVDHMETLEMEALRLSSAANSTEEEEDQPVDFSQNSVGNVMRTSILSKFRKYLYIFQIIWQHWLLSVALKNDNSS